MVKHIAGLWIVVLGVSLAVPAQAREVFVGTGASWSGGGLMGDREGGGGFIVAGFGVAAGLRMELELGWQHHGGGGDLQRALMGTSYTLDIGRISPFLTAGVGLHLPSGERARSTDPLLGLSLGAGLAFRATDWLRLALIVRYAGFPQLGDRFPDYRDFGVRVDFPF